MTIPGRGDLAPPRRYHYRRRRRWPRVLGVLLVVAVLAAGGYLGWQHWHGTSAKPPVQTAHTPRPCPSPRFATTLPRHPAAADVLNGTKRNGLAHDVAKAVRRGDHVPVRQVANAPHPVRGASVVRYSSPNRFEAWLLAARVRPPAHVLPARNMKRVVLVLGSDYQRLASPAEQTATVNAFASHAAGCPITTIRVAG